MIGVGVFILPVTLTFPQCVWTVVLDRLCTAYQMPDAEEVHLASAVWCVCFVVECWVRRVEV